MAVDSFNTNRWDYFYNYKPGHGELTSNNMTLYFVENKLSKIVGKPLIETDKDEDSTEVSN